MRKNNFILLVFIFFCYSNFVLARSHISIQIEKDAGEIKPPNIDKYAVICIKNLTGKDIKYSFAWGNNKLQSRVVNKEYSKVHSYKFINNSFSSPDFYIEYDSDFSNNNFYKKHYLKRYRSPKKHCAGGKIYSFNNSSTNVIELNEE